MGQDCCSCTPVLVRSARPGDFSAAARLEVGGGFDGLTAVELPGWPAPRITRTGESVTMELGARSGAVMTFRSAA